MLRLELLLLLLFTTSENTVPAGMASAPTGVNVYVYMVTLVDMLAIDCDAVATVVVTPPMVLRSVTATVRVVLPLVPVRATSRFTVKLPLFSVSGACSGTFIVNVRFWLFPLMPMAGCGPLGRSRVRRCGLLHR